MTTKAQYGDVASQIAKYLNSFQLAFKTYHVNEFNDMIKVIAGEGAHITSGPTVAEFERALLERGFMIFPEIQHATDGYVRIIRTNSIVGNLLNSFKYVGARGDEDLAKLLIQLKTQNRYSDVVVEE